MKFFILAMITLLIGACAPTEPETNTGSGTGNDTSVLPTPTREGDTSGDTEITGDPGSGFGLGDETSNDATNNFSGTISGAVTSTFSGAGAINCENDVYVIRADMANFPQISLILPSNPETGALILGDNLGDGSTPSATVFFADASVYASNVQGVVVIDNLATAPNQQVSGNFDFSASNGVGVINVRGEFDFISGEDAIYCP